jgi:hypothetical protein
MLSTPLAQAWTLVPCQIIPDQQHSDWRKKAVQLVCCGVDVPILPASSFGNHLGGWEALLQDRGELLFEPGMQDGVGGALHRFGSQFSSGRAKQGQQFGGITSEVLMILSNWVSFGLPGRSSLGDGLIGPGFILTPDLQSQPFSRQVRSLNDRFFSCV